MSLPIFDGLRASGRTAGWRVPVSGRRKLQLSQSRTTDRRELRLATQDADSRNAQIVVAEKSLRPSRRTEYVLARTASRPARPTNREVVGRAESNLPRRATVLVEAVPFSTNLARVELARVERDVRTNLNRGRPSERPKRFL